MGIFQGASFAGKNRVKNFDPRIRVQNSGTQNSIPRIRPQVRVSEVQNPLCRHLSLTERAGGQRESGVNKSARERIGRQNLSQTVPSKKGSLGVIFSPRNYRENAHSKSANFEGRHSGGHLLGRPLLFTSEREKTEKDGKIGKGGFLGGGFGQLGRIT